MNYPEFPRMVDYLQPDEGPRFSIKHFSVTDEQIAIMRLRDLFNGTFEYSGMEPGEYVGLADKSKREMVMSDTWMEQRTNIHVVHKAQGDVLIGGLGMGMLLLALQDKPEITSITVVELYPEIIDLITTQITFNKKVKIVLGDIFEFTPDHRYDVIYIDIMNMISPSHYMEMMALQKRLRKYIRHERGCFIDFWRRDDLRRMYWNGDKMFQTKFVKEFHKQMKRLHELSQSLPKIAVQA